MACASCWKRRNRSGSRAKAAGKTLIATSRLSRASRARYTSPMPPAPTADTISYGPSFVPGARAIRARNYRPCSTLHWVQLFWAVGRETGSDPETGLGEVVRIGNGKSASFQRSVGTASAFSAINPELLVSECDFFVKFWRTRKGPNQFADAMRDAE